MDITISVSEQVLETIREKAKGEPIEDFVEGFVEKSFGMSSGIPIDNTHRRHDLLKFAGMFSSGKTDTSERMSEIMRETDFDPAEGFGSGLSKK